MARPKSTDPVDTTKPHAILAGNRACDPLLDIPISDIAAGARDGDFAQAARIDCELTSGAALGHVR